MERFQIVHDPPHFERDPLCEELKRLALRLAETIGVAPNVIRIHDCGELPPGKTVAEAHVTWKSSWVPQVETPAGFPRQNESEMCEPGTRRFEFDLETRRSGGMGSHFGFEGYFVSVLWASEVHEPWDVRFEVAF